MARSRSSADSSDYHGRFLGQVLYHRLFGVLFHVHLLEQMLSMNHLGVVAIGRNEGDRLRRCLNSVVGRGHTVVYVDSGSTDGSTELARIGSRCNRARLVVTVHDGARRNTGFSRLSELDPDVRFVQFVDGDCELVDGWLERAAALIEGRPEVAVVCGRRRERYPDRSIYNRLADIEWNSPVGEVKYCGGDALMRVEAFRQVGGYNPALIAGEEPELCVRMRQIGGVIVRIDAEMTLHDIAMTQFRQFWKRSERAGHAYAEGAAIHWRAARTTLGSSSSQHHLLGHSSSRGNSRPGVADARRIASYWPWLTRSRFSELYSGLTRLACPGAILGSIVWLVCWVAFRTRLVRFDIGVVDSWDGAKTLLSTRAPLRGD